nr:two-pore potassium channel 5 [Tanacetum cinerariifolium]
MEYVGRFVFQEHDFLRRLGAQIENTKSLLTKISSVMQQQEDLILLTATQIVLVPEQRIRTLCFQLIHAEARIAKKHRRVKNWVFHREVMAKDLLDADINNNFHPRFSVGDCLETTIITLALLLWSLTSWTT